MLLYYVVQSTYQEDPSRIEQQFKLIWLRGIYEIWCLCNLASL
jgi:hypothetical protein